MNISKYTQTQQMSQNYELEEGGLNLGDFKDRVLRQIHVVIGITFAISFLAFWKASNRIPTYQASFEILSEPVTIETKVTSSGSQSRETTEEITAVTLNEVQIKTLQSPRVIMPVVEKLQAKYPGINYDSIVKQLSLETNQQETVLEVVYQNSDRNLVEDVLEELKTAYLEYSLQRRQLGVNRGLEFLDQQIPNIQVKVDELNQKLQQLRTEYNFIEPKIQGVQISERIDNLIAQELEKKTQLEKTQKLTAYALKELNEQSTTSTTAMQVGTEQYNDLLRELQALDREIAHKSAIFSDNSVEMQILRERREGIIALIDREIATIKQKLNNQIQLQQEQVQAIEEEITSTQQQLQEWTGVTKEYDTIERQMTVTIQQLNELLIQREALRLEAAQKEAPWRLLTPVGESRKDAASTANYVVLGTLLGLLVGIAVALIIDQYQNLIYNPSKIQEITNQPILGIIPFDRSNLNHSSQKLPFQNIAKLIQPSKSESEFSNIQLYQQNSALSNLSSPSVEAFRFLGANLSLQTVEQQEEIHSLIITSATSGEGKSTVALNLAQAKAAMGAKVLIVETDMRSQSKLSHSAMLNTDRGLSDLLSSDELSPKQVIRKSALDKSLFVLTSGNGSNFDTSKLLASPKMRNLMEELSLNFDLVIYDVASVVDYADVSLLANQVDGTILVTGLGKLQALRLEEAMSQLNISRVNVLGVVINKITANV